MTLLEGTIIIEPKDMVGLRLQRRDHFGGSVDNYVDELERLIKFDSFLNLSRVLR